MAQCRPAVRAALIAIYSFCKTIGEDFGSDLVSVATILTANGPGAGLNTSQTDDGAHRVMLSPRKGCSSGRKDVLRVSELNVGFLRSSPHDQITTWLG